MFGPFALLEDSLAPTLCGLDLALPSLSQTDAGMLYIAASLEGETITIAFFRDQEQTQQVAHATGGIGVLEVEALNDSGIRGRVEVQSLNAANGRALIGLCADDDLMRNHRGLEALLDEAGELAGKPGFRALIDQGSSILIGELEARAKQAGLMRLLHQALAFAIRDRSLLRQSAIYFALAHLERWLGHQAGEAFTSQQWSSLAESSLERLSLRLAPSPESDFELLLQLNRRPLRRA